MKLKGINALAVAYPERPDTEQMDAAWPDAARLGATLPARKK